MKTCTINDIGLIEDYLLKNNAVIMETDTVLGIFSKNLDLIYKIKQRPAEKKIVLLIDNVNQIPNGSNELLKLAKGFWPGKLTIVYNKISYRIPNQPYVLNILKKLSWMYCSSANISGQNVFKNTQEALDKFKNSPFKDKLLIVDGQSNSSLPSTIYDLDEHKLLRQGEITLEEINRVLEEGE